MRDFWIRTVELPHFHVYTEFPFRRQSGDEAEFEDPISRMEEEDEWRIVISRSFDCEGGGWRWALFDEAGLLLIKWAFESDVEESSSSEDEDIWKQMKGLG